MSGSRLLLFAILGLSACAHRASQPGHETPHVPGVRIIKQKQAAELGVQGSPSALSFGDNQDGTKLVLEFLDQAKKKGAEFVSDISIVLVTRRDGQLMSCETRLLPFAKTENYKVPHQIPGRTETRQVMRPVTRTVTEQQYQCRMVSQPVTRTETSYQSQYDYISKTTRTVPVTRTVTRYEMRNECRYVPVTRTVTRYEYQMETKYIPPKLTYLSAHYTDFDLIESQPECSPQGDSPANARLPHRIVGTLYKKN